MSPRCGEFFSLSAKAAAAQARQQFERQIQDLLLSVVQAYWELVFARDNYRVVAAALGVAQEQLRITEERIRVQELAPRDRIASSAACWSTAGVSVSRSYVPKRFKYRTVGLLRALLSVNRWGATR